MRLLILIDSHTLALHESALNGEDLVRAVRAQDPCLHLPYASHGWQAVLLDDLVIALPAAGESRKEVPMLNQRQATALSGMLEGLNTKQIAVRMNVAQSTVRKYIREVQARLGVSTREEAIRRALSPGNQYLCGDENA